VRTFWDVDRPLRLDRAARTCEAQPLDLVILDRHQHRRSGIRDELLVLILERRIQSCLDPKARLVLKREIVGSAQERYVVTRVQKQIDDVRPSLSSKENRSKHR
jgi:hypothetical protein